MSSFRFWAFSLATVLTFVPHEVRIFVLTGANAFRTTHQRKIHSTQKEAADELVARLSICHANRLETLGLDTADGVGATGTDARKVLQRRSLVHTSPFVHLISLRTRRRRSQAARLERSVSESACLTPCSHKTTKGFLCIKQLQLQF